MSRIQTLVTAMVVGGCLLAIAYVLSMRDPYVESTPPPQVATLTQTVRCPPPVQCCDSVLARWALAMDALAQSDHVSIRRLERRYGWSPLELVTPAIVYGALYHVPPEVLVSMAWWESRWNPKAVGDGGVSCGLTQVRTDYEGRPTCKALQDPAYAIEWTAKRLDAQRDDEGHLQISRYNGAGPGAVRYEVRIWRTANLLRRYTE